jgi:bacillolysin
LESTCYADGLRTTTAQDLNNDSRTINSYLKGSTYYLLDITKPMFDGESSVIPDDPQGAILTLDMDNTTGDNQTFKYIVSSNNVWNNPIAVSAHYNAGVAYEYYLTKHNRHSIDGNNGTIYSIINVADQETGGDLDNAFWSGKFMWYGNGDVSFKPLAGGLDVAGHEMTHGVINNTANLEYDGESGAINESFADIFGAMMDDEDWTLGEDVVLLSAFPSGALRSLSNPHNGGSSLNDMGYQPRTMNEKYTGDEDNHGVHINSGISNYAFYLFAQAIGKENAANIYYKALTDYLTKSSQFIDLRIAIIQATTDLFGAGSNQVTQAGLAFDAVGITAGTGTNINNTLPVNPGDEYILVYNTDSISTSNTLYRTNAEKTFTEPISSTKLLSRPSITDDGSKAVFVAGDRTLHEIRTSPTEDPQEFTMQSQQIWANVVVSKDGERLAAVLYDIDTAIWVYDYNMGDWTGFHLYNPSYTEGINASGPLYADALEWDYSGEYLVYDCFNSFENTDSKNIEFWDVNFIRVWDNSSNNFGDGTVSKLFSSLPDSVSIGNPSFSKNSPGIIAFDYINEGTGQYAILGCNIDSNNVYTIIDNNTIGWPSYNKDDSRLAYTTINDHDTIQTNYIGLDANKITSNGSPVGIFFESKWPVYFATGTRNLHTGIKQFNPSSVPDNLQCFPNPFNDFITIKLNQEFDSKTKIEVINQLGQIVYSPDVVYNVDNMIKLNLSGLKAGYYIIRASTNTTISVGRVLKTNMN